MIDYNHKNPLISIHIEKTGGTSFRHNLEAWFGRKLYLHYPDPTTEARPDPVRLHTRFLHKPRTRLCIHGHFNMLAGFGIQSVFPSVQQFITWVRDPLDLQTSLFSHQMRTLGQARIRRNGIPDTTMDIDEFLESARCPILRAMPEPVTAESLPSLIAKRFIHVGVLELAPASLACMAAKLHKKPAAMFHENPSPRTQTPSESACRRFRTAHTLEYQLYEIASRMNR